MWCGSQVSAEMIRELGLSDEELGQISLTITNLAEKARKRRIRRTSSAGSATAGLPGGPSSLTPVRSNSAVIERFYKLHLYEYYSCLKAINFNHGAVALAVLTGNLLTMLMGNIPSSLLTLCASISCHLFHPRNLRRTHMTC